MLRLNYCSQLSHHEWGQGSHSTRARAAMRWFQCTEVQPAETCLCALDGLLLGRRRNFLGGS
jgi:hypothetical protein